MSSNQICGYISLLYSVANEPLKLWSKHVSLDGKVHRVSDDALHGDKVIEILGSHDSVVPTSIIAPAKIVDTLNIRLAVLVLVIKNLKSHFKLEIQVPCILWISRETIALPPTLILTMISRFLHIKITDKKQYRRRFLFLTYNLEKLPSVNASVARVPLKLEECWNTLEINLQTLCRVAYGTDYEALQKMIVYPNCRLRRVYLQDRHYDHDETPIELCNAFFDTYMSKWGINFIEKTCQTEERHTGLSKERDSNLLANNDRTTVSPTRSDLSKDNNDTNKSKNLNALVTIANLCNSKTLKKNYVLLDTLKNKAKMHSGQNVKKQRSWCHSKTLINESIVINKLKESSNNIVEKQGNRNKEITYEMQNSNSFMKLNNHVLHSASSVGTSQFLKMHADKTLFQNKPEFPRRLYPYRIRDLKATPVIQRRNVDSITNTKFGIFVANVPLTSNLSENIGFSCDKMKNDIIVYNDKHAKKNENIINGLRSSVTVEGNIEDNCTPHLIGKKAKLDNVTSTSTCLKNNKTMYDLISARSFVNRRFFEKLQDKGLVR